MKSEIFDEKMRSLYFNLCKQHTFSLYDKVSYKEETENKQN